MGKDNGGPAFPQTPLVAHEVERGYGGQAWEHGMSLRDYFAAKAMQADISNWPEDAGPWDKYAGVLSAKYYLMADAMLKERAK